MTSNWTFNKLFMRNAVIIFSVFFVLICSGAKSQNISGTYKIAGDSYSEGTLILSQSETDSTYSFTLNKKTKDCGSKSLSGELIYCSDNFAEFKPKNESCSMIFKRNGDAISIIVNCENDLDYLCSFSGRFLFKK